MNCKFKKKKKKLLYIWPFSIGSERSRMKWDPVVNRRNYIYPCLVLVAVRSFKSLTKCKIRIPQ